MKDDRKIMATSSQNALHNRNENPLLKNNTFQKLYS